MKKKTVFVTVKDLQKRWNVRSSLTIRHMAARYKDILKPKKIAGKLLFHPDDIKKYEEHKRIVNS